MASKEVVKFVNGLVFNSFLLAPLPKSGLLSSSINTAYKNPSAWNYSTKTSNVTGRLLKFLKGNPEKVVQVLKKELNAIPTGLKIGTGLYDPRPFKTIALRKPSVLYHPLQNTQVSAKGTRNQFRYPEKEPNILDRIKRNLLMIDGDAKSSKKREFSY